MESLFLITNVFALRPFLNSNHHFVLDGGVNLTVKEWIYWSDKDGIPNENPSLCITHEVLDTDCGSLIYPLGIPVGKTKTMEDELQMQALFN